LSHMFAHPSHASAQRSHMVKDPSAKYAAQRSDSALQSSQARTHSSMPPFTRLSFAHSRQAVAHVSQAFMHS